MPKSVLKIAKVRKGDKLGGWWVIDSTYGIHLKQWFRTLKEARAWCTENGYEYSDNWEY